MLRRKLFSLALVLTLALVLLSVNALAAEDAPQRVDGYYEIYTADQLYWFAEQVNGGNTSINGKLMADIVVNENVLNADGTLNGDGSNFRVWTPIGNSSKAYIGIFDGNGKLVKGLYFNDASVNCIGLVGYVGYGGGVMNVAVVNSYLKGKSYVGGVVGENFGFVSCCYYTNTTGGSSYVGGNSYVGGLVGRNCNGGIVSGCNNVGTVSGSFYVGGVVGENSGDIIRCINFASVSGSDCVGGVVGLNFTYGSVSNSYNDASVCGTEKVGGVAGINNAAVRACHNSGSVSGCEDIGGVAGSNAGTVENCYNIGTISGISYYGGGVVGQNHSTVSNCYNYGFVTGMEYVGGMVGSNNSKISNCYYLSGCCTSVNEYGTAMTAEQFASGEVAYLLQGEQTEQIWGQLIGAEPYPAFRKDKVNGGNGYYYNDCDHDWVRDSCTEGVNCLICGAFSSYSLGHQWLEATCSSPATCSVCGETKDNILGHEYQGEVTAPTCTNGGYTTYSCILCGDVYFVDEVAALGHGDLVCSFANNTYSFSCDVCGEVAFTRVSTDGKQFKFNTAAPALSDDIVMNIATTLPTGFSDPYMVVEFNGVTSTITDYAINADNGRYVFAFLGINPQTMGDTFHATLYAIVDGIMVSVSLDYSMLKYINSQLKKDISTELRTALSDLVMYGEANQVYEGYKTDALLSTLLDASATLTPSTFSALDGSYNQMTISGTGYSGIDLKGVSMVLGSKVIVRMTLQCADASAYSVKVNIGEKEYTYAVSDLKLAEGYTDRYVVEFDQIKATQFGDVITFSFLDADGNAVGRTLEYSVYTYVQKNQGSSDTNLVNLLQAIYYYGEAVKKI